jgi:hypothetical protein
VASPGTAYDDSFQGLWSAVRGQRLALRGETGIGSREQILAAGRRGRPIAIR